MPSSGDQTRGRVLSASVAGLVRWMSTNRATVLCFLRQCSSKLFKLLHFPAIFGSRVKTNAASFYYSQWEKASHHHLPASLGCRQVKAFSRCNCSDNALHLPSLIHARWARESTFILPIFGAIFQECVSSSRLFW